ncbi:hypothetical protein Csa_016483 [Cucumis sativus]|uniref:Uncharacterized protein n=1 Tax=Cucumis sativus TaxID=3659 RepID=A0A0A0K8A0_CUCSA|nr:hypothetical protein Csa_016483 [Cucumis sativus]
MFGKQDLTKALKKYQATVGKASPFSDGVEHSPFGSLVLEQRKEEIQLKMVVINGVKIQLLEDKLGNLLAIVSRETSKREKEQKEQEEREMLEKEGMGKERVEEEQKERE